MCNDFGNKVPYSAYVDALAGLRIPLKGPAAIPNLEPREDIRPTDPAPVLKGSADGTAEFSVMRWGFLPGRPKAPPVINFRSDGRTFDKGRCLVPASHFFEFTGTKYPKTKWRFTVPGEDWFCIAGLWRLQETPNGPEERFTLLTCEPGPDVAKLHDRQIVVLPRGDWAAWLNLSLPMGGVCRPSPEGTFAVEQVAR